MAFRCRGRRVDRSWDNLGMLTLSTYYDSNIRVAPIINHIFTGTANRFSLLIKHPRYRTTLTPTQRIYRRTDTMRQYVTVIRKADLGYSVESSLLAERLAKAEELTSQTLKADTLNSVKSPAAVGDLIQIAAAEAQFYAVQFEQLKTDPSFFHEQIEQAARNRVEILPDSNGLAPTAEELLAIPRFVGQLCRYTIHNLIVHWGIWNLISKCLSQIQDLEERKGDLGAFLEREQLMSHVKYLIEDEIWRLEKGVRNGICIHTVARTIWIRDENYPDFAGARIASHPDKDDEFNALLYQDSLDGAFVRFAARDVAQDELGWTPHQSRVDLFRFLDKDPLKWQALDPYLGEQLTLLRRLTDFENMLQFPDSATTPGETPGDQIKNLANSLLTSEAIFKHITLEKHIKKIESLERASITRKIWRDINHVFNKEFGSGPEYLTGFEQAAPEWNMPLPSTSTSGAHPDRRPSPPPAKIKPYWDGAAALRSPDTESAPTPTRVGPKVKSRPQERETQVEDGSSSQYDLPERFSAAISLGDEFQSSTNARLRQPTQAELPVFLLSKTSFEVFERIFSPGERGQLSFSEFGYAMVEIGFTFDGRGDGSRTGFHPPPLHSRKPFYCHTPHGNRTTLDPTRLHQYKSNLNGSYGWTMEWFALKSDNSTS